MNSARAVAFWTALIMVLALAACTSASPADSTAPRGTASTRPPSALIVYQTALGLNAPDSLGVIRADGTGDHPIVQISGMNVAHPRWSSDGTKLVFEECRTSRAKCTIVESNPDGGERDTVYDCGTRCFGGQDPSLSPDGSQVAFSQGWGPVTRPPTFCGLTIDTIGGPARTILRQRCPDGPAGPRWSPNGKKLVFTEVRRLTKNAPGSAPLDDSGHATATAVLTINVDGTGIRQLTPWRMDGGDPDWSPDGKLIVFTTNPLIIWNFNDATSDVYTIRPDGTGMRQVTHDPNGALDRAAQPTWTSDGNILYVLDEGGTDVSSRTIWVMGADGSHPHRISPEGYTYTHPQEQP